MAVVSGVDRRIDAQNRMIAAMVRVPNRSGLLPGAAVRADIVVALRKAVLTVPSEALLYTGEQAYVFVAAERKAQHRDVKIGVRDGDKVEIIDGLKANEIVVVAGNSVLEDGMALRTAADIASAPAAAGGTEDAGK